MFPVHRELAMNVQTSIDRNIAERPTVIDVGAYTSRDYAREEDEKLWAKVWQVACREEELRKVGDFVTYDIMDESVIVVRSAEDKISAYYNVCLHRGRQLTEGCGHTKKFVCKFHGWKWNLQGENVDCLEREQWEGALTDENLKMKEVKVGTWGGWVFINMDPDCEPLESFLDPANEILDPFEIDKMRYRWRQWLTFPCNWKVAIEAFMEGYHVPGTHPQLTKYNKKSTWSLAHGKHSNFGPAASKAGGGAGGAGDAPDMRVALNEVLSQLWEERH